MVDGKVRCYGDSDSLMRVYHDEEWGVPVHDDHEHFELLAPVPLNVICFRYHPAGVDDSDELNDLNNRLMNTLNESGKMYLTHTKLKDDLTLRLVIAQTHTSARHVGEAWRLIQRTAATLS